MLQTGTDIILCIVFVTESNPTFFLKGTIDLEQQVVLMLNQAHKNGLQALVPSLFPLI